MAFDFFTFGGGFFWEDVFFYQKWRIQRNYKTKQYRLLDNWDICRGQGSFEKCKSIFIEFISVYEISRQKGHMIIMLHGLGDSKNIFKPLWRAATLEKYLVAAINYPSTLKSTDAHVRQLDFFMNHLEDVKEISFVTKGSGAMVLRKLLATKTEWRESIKIKRIVEVCPPNKGSKFFAFLARKAIIKKILGPMLEETAINNSKKNKLNLDNIELGIVATIPNAIDKLFDCNNEAFDSRAKSFVKLPINKINPFNDAQLTREVMNFIKFGKYSIK